MDNFQAFVNKHKNNTNLSINLLKPEIKSLI